MSFSWPLVSPQFLPGLILLDTTLSLFACVFALLTAYVFADYYRAMWHYKRTGDMRRQAGEVVEFVNDYLGVGKRPCPHCGRVP